MSIAFTRHIDVRNNLVFINSLESVSMDLSRLPENLLFYIEIGDFWKVQFNNEVVQYPYVATNKEWAIRKIALEILEEAVLIWEEERKIKFTKDMYKEYEDKILEDWNNEIRGLPKE